MRGSRPCARWHWPDSFAHAVGRPRVAHLDELEHLHDPCEHESGDNKHYRVTAATLLPVTADQPCGRHIAKASYSHVMWVWMENESISSIIGAPDAPYETALAHRCGIAANYYAITHPSLPNYLAATGGTTAGVTDDGEPSTHPITGSSIFSQIDAAKLTWRAYAESMPTPCDTVTSGVYAARHNPAVYYVGLRRACARDDIAMGSILGGPLNAALERDALANFVFVTPNICDDAHSCPVADGDAWLSRFLSMVFTSRTYRLGHLVVFVTFDEGNVDNHVPTIVAGPSVPRGTVSNRFFDHYSLLRTAEQLLGLRPLLNASTANSMVAALVPRLPRSGAMASRSGWTSSPMGRAASRRPCRCRVQDGLKRTRAHCDPCEGNPAAGRHVGVTYRSVQFRYRRVLRIGHVHDTRTGVHRGEERCSADPDRRYRTGASCGVPSRCRWHR